MSIILRTNRTERSELYTYFKDESPDASPIKKVASFLTEGFQDSLKEDDPNMKFLNFENEKKAIKEIHQQFFQLKYQFKDHRSSINALCFSNDGKKIISGDSNSQIILWGIDKDSQEKNSKISTFLGHEKSIISLIFSKDDLFFYSSSEDCSIIKWEISTKKKITALLMENPIKSISLNSENTKLVAGDFKGQIRLWLFEVNKTIELLDHTLIVNSIIFKPNSNLIISGSSDRTIKYWNSDTGKLIKSYNIGDIVNVIVHHPKEDKFAWGSSSNTIKIYASKNFSEINRIEGHEDEVTALAFRPFGTKIVSGSLDGSIRVWYGNGSELNRIDNGPDINAVKCVIINPSGTLIAAGGNDNMIKIWEFGKPPLKIENLNNKHKDSVNALAFNNNKDYIASGSQDKTLKLWQWDESKKELININEFIYHKKGIKTISFSHSGKFIASSGEDNFIVIWDIENQDNNPYNILEGHLNTVNCVVFNHNESKLASGSKDCTIRFWDFKNKDKNFYELKKIEIKGNPINCLSYSPHGTKLVSGGDSNFSLRVWDTLNYEKVMSLTGHSANVNVVSFNKDGRLVASGSNDQTIRVFNIKLKSEIAKFECHTKIRCLLFYPDSSKIVSGGNDNRVRFWNIGNGNEISNKLYSHEGPINALCINSKGTIIISGSEDKNIQMFLEQEDEALLLLSNFLINKNTSCDSILDIFHDLSFNYFVSKDEKFSFSLLHALIYERQNTRIISFLNELKKNKTLFKNFSIDHNGFTSISLMFNNKNAHLNDNELLDVLDFYIIPSIKIGDFYEKPIFFLKLLKKSELFAQKALQIIESRFIDTNVKCNLVHEWNFSHAYKSSDCDFDAEVSFFVGNDFRFNCKLTTSDSIINFLSDKIGFIKKLFKKNGEDKKLTNYQNFYRTKLLDIKEIVELSEDTNKILEKISEYNVSNAYYQSSAICSLIEYKWNKYGRSYFFEEFIRYILFLIIITINSNYFLINYINDKSINNVILFSGLSSLIFLFTLYFVYLEINQRRDIGKARYWSNLWNILDIITILMNIITSIYDVIFIFMDIENQVNNIRLCHSLSVFVSCLRILDYFRGFRSTSVFILIILQVSQDIKVFIFLLLGFLLIFGISINVLRVDNNELNSVFPILYKLLLGDFDSFDELYDNTKFTFLISMFFLASTLLLMIILLNLLIAIISDSYEKIMGSIESAIVQGKVRFLVDIEKTLLKNPIKTNLINKTIKKFLLVVFKNDEDQVNSDDNVRLRSVIEEIKEKQEAFFKKSNNDFVNFVKFFENKINKIQKIENGIQNIEEILKKNENKEKE